MYPVFVDGSKIGEASYFDTETDIEHTTSYAGPLTAAISDEYHMGDEIVRAIGASIAVTLDVFVHAGKEFSTVEVAVPDDDGWVVHEYHDVVSVSSTDSDHGVQRTHFLATEHDRTVVDSLGPDTNA